MYPNTLPLKVKRKGNFNACAVSYKIFIDNIEYGSISNGGEIDLTIPNKVSEMRVEMWGNKMALHPIRAQVIIDPSHCRQGYIECEVVTKTRWTGIFFSLFTRQADILVNVTYF